MTNDMESGQATGAQGTPTPDTSQSGDKQSSAISAQLEALAKKLESLDSTVRTMQSGKDKGVQKLTREFAKLKSYLDKYGDPEEAERQYKIDRLLGTPDEEDDQAVVPPKKSKAAQPEAASEDVDEELLQMLGVEPNDPELLKQLRAGKSQIEAAKAAAKAKKAAPEASASGVIPMAGGGSAQTSKAALQAQYDAEVAKLPRPVSPDALHRVQVKYRKAGLDVW